MEDNEANLCAGLELATNIAKLKVPAGIRMQNASRPCESETRSLQPRTVTACGFSSSLHEAENTRTSSHCARLVLDKSMQRAERTFQNGNLRHFFCVRLRASR